VDYDLVSVDFPMGKFPIRQGKIIRRVLWVLESLDKRFEEHFSSSGQRKRRSCGRGCALGGAFCVRVVSDLIACLYISGKRSKEEKEHSDTHQVVSE
jgi:hypothetical protein